MTREILLLRLSYWITALADFGIAVAVLMPGRMGAADILYPMGLMSAVAFSWGVLLLFADRRPLERRWVLLPTILVIGLLSAVRVIFAVNDAIAFSLAYLLFGVCLIILLAYSYFVANRLATGARD